MVIACPACGGVYRFRREMDGSGTRVSCPDCMLEFVMLPSQLEATGERSVITLPDPGISVTPDGERIAAPMEVPLDDEPSDNEVLSATAVGEYTSPPRIVPQVSDRFRRLEQELSSGASGEHRPIDHPSIEPDAELIRVRNNRGVDPATFARRLLEEERMIPQARFVPVDSAGPVRWMVAGAVFMGMIVVCGTLGAVAGGSSDKAARGDVPQLRSVITTATPVSAAVAAPIVQEEDEQVLAEEAPGVGSEAPSVVETPPPVSRTDLPEILQSR